MKDDEKVELEKLINLACQGIYMIGRPAEEIHSLESMDHNCVI